MTAANSAKSISPSLLRSHLAKNSSNSASVSFMPIFLRASASPSFRRLRSLYLANQQLQQRRRSTNILFSRSCTITITVPSNTMMGGGGGSGGDGGSRNTGNADSSWATVGPEAHCFDASGA